MSENIKQKLLKQYYGYDTFREGQELLIDSILKGGDCVGVMPTGAGKSLCFQIPGVMLGGITLVVSPLISLMKDQVNTLTQMGIQAAYINSSLTERQIYLAISKAEAGAYKIIYVAPERLEETNFLDFARRADISQLTVDEAHCISQWGQDFRPSYMRIPEFLDKLAKRPTVSAFTATATLEVREDIINLLRLKAPTVLVTGFDRKNLFFSVKKPASKFAELMNFLSDKREKSGIVYCATRNAVEEVCLKLQDLDYNASRYHAGLSDNERQKNQEDFLYDRVRIMVATNAFGMGIDKSNVSFVVHYNMPKNLESYYQEAGRAGRDGSPADCLLLYSGQDVRLGQFMIESGKDMTYPDAQTEKALKERDRQRLKVMTFYCHTSNCLREYILKYFGETTGNFCGNCENCNTNFENHDVTEEAQKIVSCVIRSKERFGVNVIIGILRGSKNERILRRGLDKLSTYNISRLSENRLREIINHLVMKEVLMITDDEYPILKSGPRVREALTSGARVEMRLAREIAVVKKSVMEQGRPPEINGELLARLKLLRKEIASEQNVPAFVVFSDSTLMDMCIRRPGSNEEMMDVSGIGGVKLERYGKRFLEAIAKFVEENPKEGSETEGSEQGSSGDEAVEISEDEVTISVIADRVNCILIRRGIKKLTGAKINEWLEARGYLRITELGGSNFKTATTLGTETGIKTIEREIRGRNCLVNYYNKEAQRLIADNLQELCGVELR